jgi:uncharacterized repeat protein (TIGR01451 family)
MKKTLLAVAALLSLCSYGQQAEEGFDGAWPPVNWLILNNGVGSLITWEQADGTVTQPAYDGVHAAYLNKENVATGIPADYLVTPLFTVPNNMNLSFYSRLTLPSDQGGIYSIRILPAGLDETELSNYVTIQTWTELEINPEQTEYEHKIVAVPAEYSGTSVRIAFVMEGDDADRWLIDNVKVLAECLEPNNLIAANITPTSADLAWNNPGASYQWEVEVLPADAAPTGIGVITVTNPYAVDGLEFGEYKYYVRALCADGGVSAWTGPLYFSTLDAVYNILSGTVLYDANGDGICSGLDNHLPSMEIQVTANDEAAYSVYTNDQGAYTLYNMPIGTYTVSLQAVPPSGFPEIGAVSQEVTFSEILTAETIDLCLPQPEMVSDLSVSLVPTGLARPGFYAHYDLIIQNAGSTEIAAANATITFNDDRLNFFLAEQPNTVTGNTVTFPLENLEPYTVYHRLITMDVLPPATNVGGETLEFTSQVAYDGEDVTPGNNTAGLSQIIVNSFDPNDIAVHEGPFIMEEQADDYLNYTIRFQNTGTASAVNIRLENTLDSQLDWSTFEPVAASHAYNVTRIEGQLEFKFDNIFLPDDDSDEPGSHGYVSYRIKPNADFGLGDIVSNAAEIYFDFNPAIYTNTATTEVVPPAAVSGHTFTNITVYPNPVKDKLHIGIKQGELLSATVFDLNGRKCIATLNSDNTIDTQNLKTGIYFVKVATADGISVYKIIKE